MVYLPDTSCSTAYESKASQVESELSIFIILLQFVIGTLVMCVWIARVFFLKGQTTLHLVLSAHLR